MPRFPRKHCQSIDLAIRAKLFRGRKQTNPSCRKFRHDFPNPRQSWVTVTVHGKQDFVVRVVLLAEAYKIFQRPKVYTAHRLKKADGRTVVRQGLHLRLSLAEETEGGNRCKNVVNQRGRGQ